MKRQNLSKGETTLPQDQTGRTTPTHSDSAMRLLDLPEIPKVNTTPTTQNPKKNSMKYKPLILMNPDHQELTSLLTLFPEKIFGYKEPRFQLLQ